VKFITLFWIAVCAAAQDTAPVFDYGVTFGGSGDESSRVVAVDPAGHVYVAGTTNSTDFPRTAALFNPRPDAADLFVAKLAPDGKGLLYSVVIGRMQADPRAAAVDASGNFYVTGTASGDFPAIPGAFSTEGCGFALKIDPAGELVYAARLSRTAGFCEPEAIAVDAVGSAYVAGYSSVPIETTPGAYRREGFGPFALKFNPQGSAIYATYLPGTAEYAAAHPKAIALDAAGNAYIAGRADRRGFPATITSLSSSDNGDDVFVLKLNAAASAVEWSVLFGGRGADSAAAVALDSEGYVYVSGEAHATTDANAEQPFPTTEGTADRQFRLPAGFLTKLQPGGHAFAFSTFLPHATKGLCVGMDAAGKAVVVASGGLPEWDNRREFGSRVMQFDSGGALRSTALVSLSGSSHCGVAGDRVAVGGGAPRTPNTAHLGASGRTDASAGLWTLNVLDAPVLDVHAGLIRFDGGVGANGRPEAQTRQIPIEAGGMAVPYRAMSLQGTPVLAEPFEGVTPAPLELKANPGGYTGSLAIAAAGVANGLVHLPVAVSSRWPFLEIAPVPPAQVESAVSPPAAAVLRLTSRIWNAFGREIDAPSPFEIVRRSPAAWLSVEPESGMAPVDVKLTMNPSGLNAGLYSTLLDVRYTDYNRFPPQTATRTVPVQFRIGPTPPAAALLVTTPRELQFRLTRPDEAQTRTIRLESTGEPLPFQLGVLPPEVTASVSSGTTPADVAITVKGGRIPGRTYTPLPIRAAARDFTTSLIVDYVPAGYLASLEAGTFSGGFGPAAPGALLSVRLPPEIEPPSSFVLGGATLPVIAVNPFAVVLQVPFETEQGSYDLFALDGAGARVGSGLVTVASAAPTIYASRATTAAGAIADDENPVSPGDPIRVRITGQGAVTPPLAAGELPSPDTAVRPVLPVTAKIGGKPAKVISAEMSRSGIGVLDIWIETPTLYPGDHLVEVAVGYRITGGVPLRVGPSVAGITFLRR
jgi:uncharacterized protein (TIGR03437 family)